jgi:hypothetical protein
MEYNISDVIELKKQRNDFQDKLRTVTTPRLTDCSLLERIFPIIKEKPSAVFKTPIDRRIAFVMVATMLFAPKTFLGYNMPYGLRQAIGRLCGASETAVSRALSQGVSYYRFYRAYKDEIDDFFRFVSDSLGE